MEEFKIGDSVDENGNEKAKQYNKKFSLIIILIVSLVSGLTVFFISNALFGKKETHKEEVPLTEELSLTDETVEILYSYVTYGVKDERNDKFLKNEIVTQSDFSDEEKYYYALQFAEKGDFTETSNKDEEGNTIYELSSTKMKYYMQRFFGEEVKYSEDITIDYPFSFGYNNKNVASITYDKENKTYKAVFNKQDISVESHILNPYLSELIKATRNSDGSIVLEENVLYTDVQEENGTYTVLIYKDFEKSSIIEKKTNLKKEDIEDEKEILKKYKDRGTTIQYTFKTNKDTYYFDNSKMTE